MELITLVAVICNQQFCQQKVIADSNHVPLTLQHASLGWEYESTFNCTSRSLRLTSFRVTVPFLR
ncbi:MAG TPA: hypothetical protein VIL63_11165, partial [Terriglobales bacterium]